MVIAVAVPGVADDETEHLAATALAALATARLAERALFDHAHRLVPLM